MSKLKQIVLVDGDVFVYRAAWACNTDPTNEALDVLEGILAAAVEAVLGYYDKKKVKVFLTGKGNFRYKYLSDYKGNRTDPPKPVHIADLRQRLIDKHDAIVSEDEEADDLIGINATSYANRGYEVTVVSIDKDMLQIPCWHFNPVKEEWSKVSYVEGLRSFYKQLLTGDRVDNIKGVDGIGPVKAGQAIDNLTTETEMLDTVLKLYDGDLDRLTRTGIGLWLRREPNEIWSPPNA